MLSLIVRIKRYIKFIFGNPSERANAIKESNQLKIGDDCEVYKNVMFGSEPYLIKIGDNVRLTEGVKFITHDGGMWVLRNIELLRNADKFGEIVIGNNVHVGINTVIMPGVTIGNNVIIGVCSVVTKDIPSNSIAAGVPAKVIGTLDEYYEKNKNIVDFTKDMNPDDKKKYLLNKYN